MGQTYPHKETIKKLGGTFVPGRKVWKVPYSENCLQAIKDLCLHLGGGSFNGQENLKPEKAIKPVLEQVLAKKEDRKQDKAKDLLAAPSNKESNLTIEQLYSQVEYVLQKSFVSSFWLIGEVESIAYRKSAIYLTLVEKNQRGVNLSVNAIVWQGQLKEICNKHTKEAVKDVLQEGLKLCLLCQLTLYKGRGQISLHVKDLNPLYTKGALALEKEQVIKQLKSSGLYSLNKKRTLCRFPFRIGLITAEESRAYSDFYHQLTQKGFCAEVFFVSSTMQGQQAFSSLQKAFLLLKEKKCDIIVLTRGGGSASDLRCFDSLEVSTLIAKADVPVLAAIGHHDDSCVSEEVCFQHLKTPTAAAEFILRHFEQGVFYLDSLAVQMTRLIEESSELLLQKYQSCNLRMSEVVKTSCAQHELFLSKKENEVYQKVVKFLVHSENKTFALGASLENKLNKAIYSKKEKFSLCFSKFERVSADYWSLIGLSLEKFMTRITSLDPRPWLKAGWTRLYNKEGSVVKSVEFLDESDALEAQLIDGRVNLKITSVKKRKDLSL